MLVERLLGQIVDLSRYKLFVSGFTLVFLMIGMTIFAPWISPYHPVRYEGGGRLEPPSVKHFFGTDQLGRDVLSRIIHGGQVPIIVAVASAFFALSSGMTIGLISGYQGGWLDRFLSLLMDSVYSFPSLILAIVMIAVLGPSIFNMVLAVGVVYIPRYFRVVRSQVTQLKSKEYVEAAHSLGFSDLRILFKHIAPNTINSVMAILSFNIADGILTESGLSYLGYGLPPPAPDWGFDIQNGQQFMLSGHWWLITFAGLMIILLALGFAMLGEGLSDKLNPKR